MSPSKTPHRPSGRASKPRPTRPTASAAAAPTQRPPKSKTKAGAQAATLRAKSKPKPPAKGRRATRFVPQAPLASPAEREGGPRSDRSALATAGLRDLTWARFDDLSHQLADQLRPFRPEVVIGIVKGGMFVGTALARLLGVPFIPVRLNPRSRDAGTVAPEARTAVPGEVRGQRVLVVDDVMLSGETLARARAEAQAAGASEVRCATLVVHAPKAGRERPDWFALETDDLVVFPWDFELRGASTAADPDGLASRAARSREAPVSKDKSAGKRSRPRGSGLGDDFGA